MTMIPKRSIQGDALRRLVSPSGMSFRSSESRDVSSYLSYVCLIIEELSERPEPGMPTVWRTPRLLKLSVAPLLPTDRLMPPLLTFTLTPGNMVKDLRNRIGMILYKTFHIKLTSDSLFCYPVSLDSNDTAKLAMSHTGKRQGN